MTKFYARVERKDGLHVEPFCQEKHLSRFGFVLPGVTIYPDISDPEVAHLFEQILD